MSGTGSDSGWLEAAIAWEVCASLHRQYCKGKDALFTTRQSDFVKHAENARGRAHPAQEARVPLSDGQIEQGHDAADIAPTDATIGTFNDGVRFAEKHHGITAAQEGPAEPDMRSVALAAGAYTTAYSMLSHAKVHNADVAGSTARLAAAINGLRSALGQPAPVTDGAVKALHDDMVDCKNGITIDASVMGFFCNRLNEQPATVAEDAEDAARWRTLRALTLDASAMCVVVNPRRDVKLGAYCPSHELLDALVDTIRAQAAQPEGGAKT